ncbi:uncharacterized protein LOC134531480 [Bacillus rossius redtenbacheri]|uniref:uncharacterized protein LOC134531480 n=1 Tax=Bacillus rossius redtenbacheri TaxID=93214 RepID=UPI002FDD172A
MRMEWSKEDQIKLIDLYKQQTVIWDPNNVNHFNKIRKQDAWEEIGAEMDRDVDECKKKMESLLSALRRERKKMKDTAGTGKGTDEMYRSSWFAFESLRFLLDKNKQRKTISTMRVESEERDVECGTVGESAQETVPKKKKQRVEDARLDKAFHILSSTASQLNDECQHFGNLVASKLRQYNVDTRCTIENDIMGIFLRANRGFYNNTQNFIQPHYPCHFPSDNSVMQSNTVLSNPTTPCPSAGSPTLTSDDDDFIIHDLL